MASLSSQSTPKRKGKKSGKQKKQHKSNSKANSSNLSDNNIAKKNKLRREIDIYNRLRWDDGNEIDLSHVSIVHEGKHHRLKTITFDEFLPVNEGGDVPFHRIRQFLYYGQILWDRQQRIDNLNKNSGIKTMEIKDMVNDSHNTISSDCSNNNKHKKNDNTNKKNKRENSDKNNESKQQNKSIFRQYDRLLATLTCVESKNDDINDINSGENVVNDLTMDIGFKDEFLTQLDDYFAGLFNDYKTNEFELVARYCAWKCLSLVSFLNNSEKKMKKKKKKQKNSAKESDTNEFEYILFGSAALQLDTKDSDLDVSILLEGKKTNGNENDYIEMKQECINILNRVKNEMFEINNVVFKRQISQNDTTSNETETEAKVNTNGDREEEKDNQSILNEFVMEYRKPDDTQQVSTRMVVDINKETMNCPFDLKLINNAFGKIFQNGFDSIKVKTCHSTLVSEANVPKTELTFQVTLENDDERKAAETHNENTGDEIKDLKNKNCQSCMVQMDVVVHDPVHEETFYLRNKYLYNWMKYYCFNSKDKRIQCYLFICKQWCQKLGICSSKTSTINGYGWLHIALFCIFHDYKDMPFGTTAKSEDGASINETIYPCIKLLSKDISVAHLFLKFLTMLNNWLLLNDLKITYRKRNKHTAEIVYNPVVMDVIKGEFLTKNKNDKFYTLFVLDPFVPFMKSSKDRTMNDNLAKCVRNEGIYKIINAVAFSLQQLMNAFESKSIEKFCQIFENAIDSHNIDVAQKMFQMKRNDEAKINIYSFNNSNNNNHQANPKDNSQHVYTWSQLCDICVNQKKTTVPTRRWLNCMNKGKKNRDKKQIRKKQNNEHDNTSKEEKQEKKENESVISLRLGTFNMLADELTKGYEQKGKKKNYQHYAFKCSPKYLDFFNYRLPRLIFEILQYNLDVVCCQEVEQSQFDTIRQCLNYGIMTRKHKGSDDDAVCEYDGIFMKKTSVLGRVPRHLKKKAHNHCSDGCAIFWNKNKYNKIEEYSEKLTFGTEGFNKKTGKYKKSPNIVICVRLQPIDQSKNDENKNLDIWTTHLKAGRDDNNELLRYGQVQDLMSHILHFSDLKTSHVIICGDFNSSPDNSDGVTPMVYPWMMNNIHYDLNDKGGDINKEKNGVKWTTSWMSCIGNEPEYTHYAGWMDRITKCTIDYIFIAMETQDRNELEKKRNNKPGDDTMSKKNENENENKNANEKDVKAKGNEMQDKKKSQGDANFTVTKVLDIWDVKQVEAIESNLPNTRYSSDHLLMAAVIDFY